MLPKQNRLTKRKEFNYIYKNGKATHSNLITIVSVPSKIATPRIGFSVSNKVGSAPVRNKVKRRLREIVKARLTKLKPNQNLIIIAKLNITEANYQQMQKEMDYTLSKGNLS